LKADELHATATLSLKRPLFRCTIRNPCNHVDSHVANVDLIHSADRS